MLRLLNYLLWTIGSLFALHTLIRIIRKIYKFPMPQWMANVIDNPVRRRIQPPDETAIKLGIEPGMQVLEIGPGNGRYSIAAAKRLGSEGKLVTIDIESKMIDRVNRRIESEGIGNIEARVADAYNLPFEDKSFDLVYMITVIGEMPEPVKAMKEFHRVLKTDGSLVFSELFMDPDYPLTGTLSRWAFEANFSLREKLGNFFYYTLIFEKGYQS